MHIYLLQRIIRLISKIKFLVDESFSTIRPFGRYRILLSNQLHVYIPMQLKNISYFLNDNICYASLIAAILAVLLFYCI